MHWVIVYVDFRISTKTYRGSRMTPIQNAQRKAILEELLLSRGDCQSTSNREWVDFIVPIILAWWDESLAMGDRELRGLLSELTRLAHLCRELSAVAEAREDRVRIAGKTSAYEHAAELAKALCTGDPLSDGGGQQRSERRAFLAGWAARQTAYGGMVEGSEKAMAAFLHSPGAFDNLADAPSPRSSAITDKRETYVRDIANTIKAWGHYPWTQDPRGAAEPIYDSYIAPLLAELRGDGDGASFRTGAANTN